MALGDFGGPITEMVVSFRTADSGAVDIHRGDALTLTGPYEVGNVFTGGERVLGQALCDSRVNGALIPVRVRGVCDFRFEGPAPAVDGVSGVVCAAGTGKVSAASDGARVGLALQCNAQAGTLDVLL